MQNVYLVEPIRLKFKMNPSKHTVSVADEWKQKGNVWNLQGNVIYLKMVEYGLAAL